MSNTYSVRLENASRQDWTFFLYQRPLVPDGRIASLVWIASPCTVVVGAHATLMWNDDSYFFWRAQAEYTTELAYVANGRRRIDLSRGSGMLFNLNRNAPDFDPCPSEIAPTPLTVAVAANVPNAGFTIGTAMDRADALATQALIGQRYDFNARYCIGAGLEVKESSLIHPGKLGPNTSVYFPANVYSRRYYLNQQDEWCQSEPDTSCLHRPQ